MDLSLLAHTLQLFSVQWSEKFDRERDGNEKFNPYCRNPCQRHGGDITRQSKKSGLEGYRKIVVLGGKNYIGMMEKVFSNERIDAPLSGCQGIGYMMK